MNAVLGISRLLADTPLSLEQDQYLSMITNSGHLLLTIINGHRDARDTAAAAAGSAGSKRSVRSRILTSRCVSSCHVFAFSLRV